MSLGEISGGNLRAYYKLSNTTDSGPNGYTLTNNNSVTFAAGKFTNGADFGNSGTTKSLTYSGNICSSTTPSELYIGCWFKLNSTANTSRNHFIISLTTGQRLFYLYYTISSGTVTLIARYGGGLNETNITFTADTNWHYVFCRITDSTSLTIYFDRLTTSTTLTVSSNTSAAGFAIGNNINNLNVQGFCMIDEVIIDESIYSPSGISGQSDRIKYYTQAKGRFIRRRQR